MRHIDVSITMACAAFAGTFLIMAARHGQVMRERAVDSELPRASHSMQILIPAEHDAQLEGNQAVVSTDAPLTPATAIFDSVLGPSAGTTSSSADLNPLAMLHRQAMTVSSDSWAVNAEYQLQAYLASRIDPEKMNALHIRCGSSTCEVLAISQRSSTEDQDSQSWQSMIFDAETYPWWKAYGFDQPTTSQWKAQDGRILAATFLVKGGK